MCLTYPPFYSKKGRKTISKRTKVTFSLVLIVCLLQSGLASAAPVAALASEELLTNPVTLDTAAETIDEEPISITETNQSSDVIIIQEELSLRTEYEKHFLMSHESYQVALYNEPVH